MTQPIRHVSAVIISVIVIVTRILSYDCEAADRTDHHGCPDVTFALESNHIVQFSHNNPTSISVSDEFTSIFCKQYTRKHGHAARNTAYHSRYCGRCICLSELCRILTHISHVGITLVHDKSKATAISGAKGSSVSKLVTHKLYY